MLAQLNSKFSPTHQADRIESQANPAWTQAIPTEKGPYVLHKILTRLWEIMLKSQEMLKEKNKPLCTKR